MPGYAVADRVLDVARTFGAVNLFKSYLELSPQSFGSKLPKLHSELQCSGVSLTHCPHNGKKDVADKMLLGEHTVSNAPSCSFDDESLCPVDMMAYALDNTAPATIIVISGDRDFTYGISVLKLRGYRVVSISPVIGHSSLRSRATDCFGWEEILG